MGERGPHAGDVDDQASATEPAAPEARPVDPGHTPGKRLRTQLLKMSREAIQRRAAARGTAPAPAPQPSPDEPAAAPAIADDPFALHLSGAPVQRLAAAAPEADPGHVHAAAERGLATGSQPLPHLDAIQRSFGRHDVGGVPAHVGGAAAEATRDMGAVAYASDGHVAFGATPDLHTAAHEAAHVVQQRAGVHLKGGIGEEGDDHERHADAVADRVVAGRSAEDLLDAYAPAGGAPAGVQRKITGKKAVGDETKECSHLPSLMTFFAFQDDGRLAYGARMRTLLWATGHFPVEYQAQMATNQSVKDEIIELCKLGDQISAHASPAPVVCADNDGTDLANKLWALFGGQFNLGYIQGKCPLMATIGTGNGLQGQGVTTYLDLVKLRRRKLAEYTKAKTGKYDPSSMRHDEHMDVRIEKLIGEADRLIAQLQQELAGQQPTGATLDLMRRFQDEFTILQGVVDLEQLGPHQDGAVRDLEQNPSPHNIFTPGGGTDDHVNLRDVFEPGKACSLYSLLTLAPGFMGASSPEELHTMLRRTQDLREYDDNDVVARLRLMAGLTCTMEGKPIAEVLARYEHAGKPPFIVDPAGEAHTFACEWANDGYYPRDNGENARGTKVLDNKRINKITVASIWKR